MSERNSRSFDEQLNSWLDEDVGSESEQDFAVPRALHSQVAEVIVVHGLLADLGRRSPKEDEMRVDSVMQAIEEPVVVEKPSPWSFLVNRPKRSVFVVTAMAACVVLLLILQGISPTETAAASLERIIGVMQQPIDRTYVIEVVEEYPETFPNSAKQREEIDGATLHVGGPDRYVFIRKLSNGHTRISGCDGRQSWAMREDGPVHLSSDLNRFRGGLPGHQQDAPFINLHAQLLQLREGYEVELLPEAGRESDDRPMMGLVGIKKSSSVRGPKRIEIWADRETGVIHRMFMDNLPRARGGPKSVILELTNQSNLPADFFSHDHHHEPEREVRTSKNQ